MIAEALSPSRLGKEFRRALVIAGKDIRIYCLKPPVLLFGLVFPFFLFLAFFVGKKGPIEEGIPGLVCISIFFASSNIAPAGMPFERMTKTFSRAQLRAPSPALHERHLRALGGDAPLGPRARGGIAPHLRQRPAAA